MKNRSELPQIYYSFAAMVLTHFSKQIKIFRSDNAQEYREKTFMKFLAENGTLLHHSCPGTSQQNGRAERKHRHILEVVRALLISAACPESFWGEAALTAVYTINCIPTPVIEHKSPYERLYGSQPHYDVLRVFGCACFVMLQPHERTKLEPRARLCCFLGYGIQEKGYRCWDPVSKRLRISRHVVFWEHKMFSTLSAFQISRSESPYFTDGGVDLFPDANDSSIQDSSNTLAEAFASSTEDENTPSTCSSHVSLQQVDSNEENDTTLTLRRSSRVSQQPSHLQDYHCYSVVAAIHEPNTFWEAQGDPNWQQAMQDELCACLLYTSPSPRD